MKWFYTDDCNGIVLSTRVRLARNVKGYPFAPKLSREQKALMLREIREVFEKYGTDRYNYIDMTTKSETERTSLVEEHLISREFALMPQSEKRMLIYDENSSISVMAGEEDHIRIQTVRAGLAIREAYESSARTDAMLSRGLEFAFDSRLGYLTCCPSNTGTGMRISCMLHLPMLTRNDYIKSVIEYCTRGGLTVRGFFGEGSRAEGEIYQISNQVTMGISEEETIKRMEEAVGIIVGKEKALRQQLCNSGERVLDKLWRSYGILSNVRCIDTGELLTLWSDCMLAKECGIIPELSDINLTRLLIDCMPAHIMLSDPSGTDAQRRDILRAEKIRNIINPK
ncbi:MAG: ATP--guanido phosphotransferase [Clostridia bacterium]|nr:ATP--guanido phosphotransferase [Clostridia bacterium]